MKILDKFTKEELIDILGNARSFRDFLIKVGSSFNGSASYASIKKQLGNLEIEIPIYKKLNDTKRFDSKTDLQVFIENSNYSRYHLKERIIKNKILEYKCIKCDNVGEWMGTKLSLQLEHRNGISNDNRIENLCFLCPNCHSQTDTYGGKNQKNEKSKNVSTKKESKRKEKYCECGNKIHRTSQRCSVCAMKNIRKTNRPSYIQLIGDVEELGYCGTGRKYDVSDNSVRKWIKQYEK